jgi:hypothetical protein
MLQVQQTGQQNQQNKKVKSLNVRFIFTFRTIRINTKRSGEFKIIVLRSITFNKRDRTKSI